jgi:Protein of unknown function (DUF1501)
MTRREALRTVGCGFGMLGLAGMLEQESRAAGTLAPQAPHFPAKAKHVIYLFLNGGPSHVDTFDPKPSLSKYDGKPVPSEFAKKDDQHSSLLGSPFQFQHYGESGLEVSDLFPHVGKCIDEVCVLRSMYCDLPSHPQAIIQANTGRIIPGQPSIGSWLTYGLGTENQNLPGFIAMCPGMPNVGPQLWSSAYLPSVYQGTYVPCHESEPEKMIQHLVNRRVSTAEQHRELELVNAINRLDMERRGHDSMLEGRIQSMEVAFRMQTEALDAFNISKESEGTRLRYGITPPTALQVASKLRSATRDGDFARGCLVARRLVERGVRMVQVYFGEDIPWDSHHDILVHRKLAKQADQPIAALIMDLKASGLLKETIVMVGGEFGRTPSVESSGRINVQNGRNHNSKGYTVLLAGGGFKGGMAYGRTDEFGFEAIENRVHIHDLHATILNQLGLDHKKLTYRYSGRDFRLTDVGGNVVRDIIA